jgi:hypothetical protein
MDNYGLGMADNTRLTLNILNWLAVKPEHDLSLRLDAPLFLEPNASTVLGTTVCNRGSNNESSVQLELWINGSIVDSAIIPELFVRQSFTLSFPWTPTQAGSYNVTAYVQSVPGDVDLENNVATKDIVVRPLKYVLFDQTHGTDSLGNYYVWVQSLTERGYIVNSLYTYPITSAALENYDVFIIPQAYISYSADELLAIQNYVSDGGGLLVIGDDNPYIYTDLTGFAGITWAYGGMGGMTEDVTPHPVTTGVRSVYLSSPSSILYANGVAQGIVRDMQGNITKGNTTQGNIMLAVSEQSRGKVIGFADEDTLRDYSIYEADNLLLANNMINWLSMPIRVEHDLKVRLTVPASIELGKQTSANFTVTNKGFSNEANVELYLLINNTISSSTSIPELQKDESYTASFGWTTNEPGMYNFTVYAPPVAGEENVANNVETELNAVYYVRLYIPYEALSGGTAMSWHSDDASWSFTLPFDFPFYGASYRTIYVSSNGLITFLGPDIDSLNSVPALSRKLAIAAAWSNWATYDSYDIYIWANGTYVGIRWNVKAIGPGVLSNFEAVLSSEGVIQLNYGKVDGAMAATAGLSDGAGNLLAEEIPNLNYANTIVFLPSLGKREIAVTSVESSTHQVSVGDPVDIQVTVENKGNFTENFYLTTYAIQQNSSAATMLSPPSTKVYLDPQQYIFSAGTVSVGYRFNITARVENVPNLSSWQVGLYFNGSILKATRWSEPTWDPEYVFWNQTTVAASDIGNNYILAGASLIDSQQTFNGSGKLCIVEFEITAVPQAGGEAYSSVLIVNDSDTFLLDPNVIEIPATKQNGYYEVQPQPLPGHYPAGTVFVMTLLPGEKRTFNFTWSTTGALLGDYMIHAEASQVPCETDTQDNICYDGIVTVKSGETLFHDIAVTNITQLPSFAYQGWILRMNVTVANFGNATESFTVTLYYNSTAIATQPVLAIDPNATLTLTFDWNTTMVPWNYTYTVKAVASMVQGEMDATNNELVAGQVNIKLMGDVNGDGKVNYRDLALAILAFRSYPGRARWDPHCDLNRDGMVDMRDITTIVLNFGKHS